MFGVSSSSRKRTAPPSVEASLPAPKTRCFGTRLNNTQNRPSRSCLTINKEVQQCEANLKTLAPQFYRRQHQIITPISQRSAAGNCHGYTINGKTGHFIPDEKLPELLTHDKQATIFVNDNRILHSGRSNGNILTHYLIGVGVLQSTIDQNDTAEYDARFNLPEDRQALMDTLSLQDQEYHADRILGYASDSDLDSGLYDEFNSLTDRPERLRFIQKHKQAIKDLSLHFKENHPELAIEEF